MTTAASNASVALSMAKEIVSNDGHLTGIQGMVQIINTASIELIKLCEEHASETDVRAAIAKEQTK